MSGEKSIASGTRRPRRLLAVAATALSCGALAACGGGQRLDAQEPSGTFPVEISSATFPGSQTISQHSKMTITVRNAGSKTIPDVAVTVCNVTCTYPAPPGEGTSSSAFASNMSENYLANPSRPTWVVDRSPGRCGYSCASGGAGGASTVDTNTWALGPLRPGQTAVFNWGVTAVSPGRHVLAYQVAAGLNGKAKAVLSGGGAPQGTFTVMVSKAPAQAYVNDGGQIVQTP